MSRLKWDGQCASRGGSPARRGRRSRRDWASHCSRDTQPRAGEPCRPKWDAEGAPLPASHKEWDTRGTRGSSSRPRRDAPWAFDWFAGTIPACHSQTEVRHSPSLRLRATDEAELRQSARPKQKLGHGGIHSPEHMLDSPPLLPLSVAHVRGPRHSPFLPLRCHPSSPSPAMRQPETPQSYSEEFGDITRAL